MHVATNSFVTLGNILLHQSLFLWYKKDWVGYRPPNKLKFKICFFNETLMFIRVLKCYQHDWYITVYNTFKTLATRLVHYHTIGILPHLFHFFIKLQICFSSEH